MVTLSCSRDTLESAVVQVRQRSSTRSCCNFARTSSLSAWEPSPILRRMARQQPLSLSKYEAITLCKCNTLDWFPLICLYFAWTDGQLHLSAAILGSQVPEEVRQARKDALISQQQDISQAFAESLVGREVCFQSSLRLGRIML